MLLEAGLFQERCRRGEDKEMWLRLLSITDALASPRVCISYYRAIPGQMQESVTTNVRHCVCATLEDMITRSSGARRRLLKRLFNYEVFSYARGVGQRQRVSPEVYRGFFVSINPQRYIVLLLLSYAPVSVQKLIRRLLLSASEVIGVRRRGTRRRFN
jgi:hypothetical protein